MVNESGKSMDLKGLRGNDIVLDIESGITTSEDTTWGAKQEKQVLIRGWSGGLVNADRAVGAEEVGDVGNLFVTCVDLPTESGASEKSGGEENVGSAEKMGDEKPKKKKKTCRKHPKPPRPPRAPSLDAADQKLVQEISQFTMLKRARMERMKALRRMKNPKSSSSSTNLFALAITILFCLVIVWQAL
uniref:GTPase obg n=1 Tax=Anthurium amnicola TaxID=1678845 RepID=A0A1D1YG39_9ARAE